MRILSGTQPTNKVHLGNYLGALRQYVDLQAQGEGFYFVADLHALTTVRDAARLRALSLDVAMDFLALGVDPHRAVVFRQSDVPEVTQLAWLLATVMPKAWLDRAHSYKDKLARGLQPDVGLYTYPVLMAADILIYDSDLVPVGRDQKQHLEFTQDLAARFNHLFAADYDPQTRQGAVLKEPSARILETTGVVPGTDGQKMSKSYGNTLDLFGTDKELKAQVMSIVTDSTPLDAPKDPTGCNVFALISLLASDAEREEVAAKYRAGGYGYGHAKLALLDLLQRTLGPARARRRELAADLGYVEQVLADGALRARAVAATVLERAYRACGLR